MSCRMLVVAVALVITSPLMGDEPGSGGFPIEGLEPVAAGIADAFQAINDGEDARVTEGLLALLAVRHRPDISEPEMAYYRKKWDEQAQGLVRFSRAYESIEFVGAETISSNSHFLYFVADCEKSPLMVRVDAFRYRGKWMLQGMSWQPVFQDKASEQYRHMTRFDRPVVYPLTMKTDLAAKPKETTPQ